MSIEEVSVFRGISSVRSIFNAANPASTVTPREIQLGWHSCGKLRRLGRTDTDLYHVRYRHQGLSVDFFFDDGWKRGYRVLVIISEASSNRRDVANVVRLWRKR